jgi:4-amino-4-deoxy-L-arabinose transferase-like glycosyltransferase
MSDRVNLAALVAAVLVPMAWLIHALFFAPAGFFTGDEVIHAAMVERFAVDASFVLQNGYDQVAAPMLELILLVPGVDGLVAQYPSGFSIIASPFYLLAGERGVVLLNTAATVIILLLTYKLALRLFEDARLAVNAALILGLATFAVDYAFAIWPHAIANAFIMASVYAVVVSSDGARKAWLWAVLAGLALGLGATIRAEAVIAAPILFVWLFVNSRKLVLGAGCYLAGLAVGLLLASWLNWLKFGSFVPISYGASAGNTSINPYLPFVPYVVGVSVALMSLRWPIVRNRLISWWAPILLAIAAIAVFAIPAVREVAWKIVRGLYVLLIDLESLDNIERGANYVRIADSHYLFFGILKKSLLQNLPYLGLAVFSLVAMFRGKRGKAYALCLLFPLFWCLPFAPTQWYGGLANNMRYLTPALPFLAILAAIAWREVTAGGVKHWPWLSFAALVFSVVLMVAWNRANEHLGLSQAFIFGSGLSWLAGFILALSIAWFLAPRYKSTLRPVLLVTVQMSFMCAFVAAYAIDLGVNTERRENSLQAAARVSYIEPNSHVVGYPLEVFAFQISRPEATLAIYNGAVNSADIEFVERALDQGRPVYIAPLQLTRIFHRALEQAGYRFEPGGLRLERSVSPEDGRHYGLFRLDRASAD